MNSVNDDDTSSYIPTPSFFCRRLQAKRRRSYFEAYYDYVQNVTRDQFALAEERQSLSCCPCIQPIELKIPVVECYCDPDTQLMWAINIFMNFGWCVQCATLNDDCTEINIILTTDFSCGGGQSMCPC